MGIGQAMRLFGADKNMQSVKYMCICDITCRMISVVKLMGPSKETELLNYKDAYWDLANTMKMFISKNNRKKQQN